MNLSFKTLLGVVPRRVRTVGEIVAAGVSVKKEGRTKLSTLDKLKLARAAREGGEEKFTLFETDGKVGGDFRAVYNLHMRLEDLSKAIMYYDMDDIFNVLPSETVQLLERKLDVLFAIQASVTTATTILTTDPTNSTFTTYLANTEAREAEALLDLETVNLDPTNLLKIFKGITEEEVRVSNRYYSQYGSEY